MTIQHDLHGVGVVIDIRPDTTRVVEYQSSLVDYVSQACFMANRQGWLSEDASSEEGFEHQGDGAPVPGMPVVHLRHGPGVVLKVLPSGHRVIQFEDGSTGHFASIIWGKHWIPRMGPVQAVLPLESKPKKKAPKRPLRQPSTGLLSGQYTQNQGGKEKQDWVPMYLPDADLPVAPWYVHGSAVTHSLKQIKHSEAWHASWRP